MANVLPKNHGKPYSKEEIKLINEVLSTSVYTPSKVNKLAETLERKPKSLEEKLNRIGKGGRKEMDLISANKLANTIGVDSKVVVRWVKEHGLPARREYITVVNSNGNGKTPNYLIHIDMFWLWAKKNSNLIDFWKMDVGKGLPEWAYELRKKQIRERLPREGKPWKSNEEEMLLVLLKENTLSMDDIALKLGRTLNGVEKKKRRLLGKRRTAEERIREKFNVDNVKVFLEGLYLVKSMTISEIANELDMPESTVYSLLKRKKIKMDPIKKKENKTANRWVQIGKDQLRISGEKKGKGYVYLKVKDHPFASKEGFVLEQKIVMEQQLGRYLYPWEKVKRKNGDKGDNRPENLYIHEMKSKMQKYKQIAN